MNGGLLHTFTTEHQCPFPLNMYFFLYVSNLALDSPTFIHMMDMHTFFSPLKFTCVWVNY